MAFDVEAAKRDGYTDEEIQTYLKNQGMATPESQAGTQPVPVIPANAPIDRGEEQLALGQGAALEAAKLAGYGAAGGYALKKAGDILRGPTGPATPPATGATQRIAQSMLGSPSAMAPGAVPTPPAAPAMNPAASPSWTAPAAAQQAQAAAAQANPTAGNFIERMSNLAKQYSPAAARLGVGVGAALYSGGLNTNEEQELARRRQMGFIR